MASQTSRRFRVPAAAGSVLVGLLAVSPWLASDRPAARGQAPAGAGQRPPAAQSPAKPDYSYFEKLKKQAEELRKKDEEHYRKTRAAAQPYIEAQLKTHGITDEAREQLGLTLAEINARLQPNAPPAAPGTPESRVVPGMRLDLLMKKNANRYSGTLVTIDGSRVIVQMIPFPGAKPSSIELDDIAAFQTKFGIFAYNPKTGRVVPALTYYRLNTATGNFERMSLGADAFLAEDAKVIGPTSSALALYGVTSDGSRSIGLPIPYSESAEAIPAYHLQKIITPEGVYTYDDKAQDYAYKSHAEIADEARAARSAAWQAVYDAQWQHNVTSYQIQTDRLRALAQNSGEFWVESGDRSPWRGRSSGGPGLPPPLPGRGGPRPPF